MKIALISDIHWDLRSGNQFFLDKYNEFFEKQFFPYLKENNIKTLFIGGDTWENRKKISINSLQFAKENFFDKLKNDNIKVYSILGNHDVFFKNTNEVHSMHIIEESYDNLHLIYENEVINFNGIDIAFVSWINNENYEKQINFIKNTNARYILGHFEISNFEMTRGHFCEEGLNQNLFQHFEQVWSGHFHIRSKQGNITYLGNPFQTNRGDIGYERGFHVFDTETKELEFIKNEYNIYERIYFENDLDVINFNYEYYKNKIIIVYVKNLLDANTDSLNLLVENLNKICYKVEIEEIDRDEVSGAKIEINDIKSHLEIINEYIDNIIDDKEKQKQIKNILNLRYNECLQEMTN